MQSIDFQTAARWQAIAADGDDYLLQYRTAKDERVREQHRILDGITLPPSDKFWDEFFPPNGWNCRCTAVQVNPKRYPESNSEEAIQRGRAATFQPNSKGQNKARIFRFNPGKDKKIFPPKHPYYKVPDAATEIQKIAWKEKRLRAERFLRETKLGKVFYENPAFGKRKAEFTTTTIDEVVRFAKTFEVKTDILTNIEDYLIPNAELMEQKPKDPKDKARRFFILTTKYKGKLKEMENQTVEIYFRENQNKTINIHFIGLPKTK